MKSFSITRLVFLFLGGLIVLFIVAPLLGLFLHTSMPQIFNTCADVEVKDSIWLTISVSFLTTLIFALMAIPLAYILARYNFFLKKLVVAIVDLPVVIPHSAAGIALLGFVSRDTMLGKMADSVGLSFIGSPMGIGMAMAFVSVSYLINSARDGFSSVDPKLEAAALTLGASPMRVFLTISLPLAWRGIVSGLILMFARGMSEFGAIVIIAYHPMVTPVMIYERFGSFGLDYTRPVAVLFILICLVLFIGLRLLSKSNNDVRVKKYM